MDATLDDILAAIRATTASIVGTAETCRRLNVGPDQLRTMVADGLIVPIPHMRGKGGGFCYHVNEIHRCADELAKRPGPRRVAS